MHASKFEIAKGCILSGVITGFIVAVILASTLSILDGPVTDLGKGFMEVVRWIFIIPSGVVAGLIGGIIGGITNKSNGECAVMGALLTILTIIILLLFPAFVLA